MGLIFESALTDLIALFSLLLILVYHYGTATPRHWSSLNIPCLSYKDHFIYNIALIFGLQNVIDLQKTVYNHFKNERFGGYSDFGRFSLMIKDPELIEEISIKEFSIFYNHGLKIDTKLNPLTQHLFFLEDVQWKKLRMKLSTTFSGNKMRNMFAQLLSSSEKLIDYLTNLEKDNKSFEVRSLMSKFTVDFIASSAFGLSTNAITDSENDIIKMVKQLFTQSRWRLLLWFVFPSMGKVFNIKIFPPECEEFFMNLVKNNIEYREKNNVQRNDIFQMLMEIRKNDSENPDKDLNFDDTIMAANCFVFFVGGFDSVSIVCSYLLYELAMNMNIQEKVYQEIKDKIEKNNNEISYDAVKKITYLDQAVSETLRKYSPIHVTSRESKEEYKIPNSDTVIPKGTMVTFPVHALSNDPKYFPNPEKFDPDRFQEGNDFVKGIYIPFGSGPRICIAQRLAELQVKVAVAKMLLKYKVSLDESKTTTPLKYAATATASWVVKGGLWLKMTPR